MRVKNKEIRRRRHRKETVLREAKKSKTLKALNVELNPVVVAKVALSAPAGVSAKKSSGKKATPKAAHKDEVLESKVVAPEETEFAHEAVTPEVVKEEKPKKVSKAKEDAPVAVEKKPKAVKPAVKATSKAEESPTETNPASAEATDSK